MMKKVGTAGAIGLVALVVGAACSGSDNFTNARSVACATDADCEKAWQGDACKQSPRCDAKTSVCTSELLDKDHDGVAPAVCGGKDCDDSDFRTHPGAPELCDGKDNDCDGIADIGGLDCVGAGGAFGAGGDSFFGVGGGPTLGAGGAPGTGGRAGSGGEPPGAGGKPAECTGAIETAKVGPVDVEVMLDQSMAMATTLTGGTATWWNTTVTALSSLTAPAGAEDLSLGIAYFPSGQPPGSCEIASYTNPQLEIAPLADGTTNLLLSLALHSPSGGNPTYPALSGALAHMKDWAPQHAGHAPAVLLITAANPSECDPTALSDVATLAKTAFESVPSVRTAVIGINLTGLDLIARAGGTGTAAAPTTAVAVGSAIGAALTKLSVPGHGCSFAAPTGDPHRVNVRTTPAGSSPVTEFHVGSSVDCASTGGWYYDAPVSPKRLFLCPQTCAASIEADATVETVKGCATVNAPVGAR